MELQSDCSEYLYERDIKESQQIAKRKNSYVWQYFEALNDKTFRCLICNSSVGNLTSNLARHLFSSHDIKKPQKQGYVGERGRPSRSFIWKYCTKEDSKHALCHLCKNLLYFGGGNTSNITKHLRRKHMDILIENEPNMTEILETNRATDIINGDDDFDIDDTNAENRRERKRASYVWNYCEKISRSTICCKLCNKKMRFHGTANIITHLQRKHNILGRIDGDMTNILNESTMDDNDMSDIKVKMNPDEYQPLRKRSTTTMSVVWKYCKRLSRSVVRCNCCNKNLSYQGTSNLQRHLHRMHGIVTRSNRMNKNAVQLNADFIWDYCKTINDKQIQCNLCFELYESNNLNAICQHLTRKHAITSPQLIKKENNNKQYSSGNSSDSSIEEDVNWFKHEKTVNNDDIDFVVQQKDDQEIYDIIEHAPEERKHDEEEPFDPNAIQEIPIANPLSPQTSDGDDHHDHDVSAVNGKNFGKDNRLQKLNEERLRMEAAYFREKAGYYRMQKYLTALQAKKVRIEMERLQNADQTVEYDVNMELH